MYGGVRSALRGERGCMGTRGVGSGALFDLAKLWVLSGPSGYGSRCRKYQIDMIALGRRTSDATGENSQTG